MQQSQGARGSTNGSTTTSSSSRRRPHVWQDDMAEVKETFRRVARARHIRGAYSIGDQSSPPRVTAPMLSRNRRARIRCQVPAGGLQVPVRVLQEIQGNRSQSPFVSINHLQNVLGMCRRIRSQHSLTERKKNPHDPSVYPVYVRRPWSVSPCMYHKAGAHPATSPTHISPASQFHVHVSPTPHHASLQSAEAISLPHDVSPSSAFRSPHVSPNSRQRATAHVSHAAATSSCHVSPNDPTTPLYYKPARFKPLYDISNGVFPHTQIRKRASAASLHPEKVNMSAKEKPSWTHYRELLPHPSVEDPLEVQHLVNPNHHANPNFTMQSNITIPINAASLKYHTNAMQNLPINAAAGVAHLSFPWNPPENHENFIITKKPRTRPSPMGFSESWPSSSSCFSNDHHHHLSDLQARLKLMHGLDCNDILDSDRRPHSENDLNLHSTSYFLERPPSRCMKRPLSSSFSWRNVGDLLGMPKNVQRPFDFGFADAWSANSSTSQQECSIYIPRDLNGNILKSLPSSSTCKSTSMSYKQRYCPKSKNAGYKSNSFAGALMDLSRRHTQRSKLHGNNSTLGSKAFAAKRGDHLMNSGGMKKKKKPINFSSTSCLDDLEGLPPSKWAKRLASDLMQGTPWRSSGKAKAGDYGKEMSKAPLANACCSFNSGLKHRVKFATPSVQINTNEGFRKEAQSLASTEMNIPDLLSWERDSGLLTGDPPSASDNVHAEDDEEPDQQLLEQVEAMLAASSSSSRSPSPSPYSRLSSSSPMQLCSPPSPMQLCLPPRECMESAWSKNAAQMKLHNADGMPSSSNGNLHHQKSSSRSFQREDGMQLLGSSSDIEDADEVKGTGEIALDKAAGKEDQIEEKEIKEAIDVELHEITEQEKEANKAEAQVNAGSFINIHHKTALIEVMESKCRSADVKVRDVSVQDDEEMKETKGTPADHAAEWELEKLFQDSLDLNPTLRHIYDSMNFLNSRVSPDPCSFTIS